MNVDLSIIEISEIKRIIESELEKELMDKSENEDRLKSLASLLYKIETIK